MVIRKEKNIPLPGKHGRPIPTDIVASEEGENKPVILFCHGYKGFKDWGAWNLMAEEYAKRGFVFIKFNFAFNGGTLEEPIDFPDLDAFSQNTYTKELDDLQVVLNWIEAGDFPFAEKADSFNLTLMGHSRGGGLVVIKAAEDQRVKKLVTLAAVSDFGNRFPGGEELKIWKEKGIAYVENSRTKQQMPHLIDFYEDFKQNEARLTISTAAKSLEIPTLIVHGTEDLTVSLENAYLLKEWIGNSELLKVEGSNHVFDAAHPWTERRLPLAMERIVSKVSSFVRS